MRRGMLLEAEHRRGLVLGFTLAEVLLLLLFLLLLALGGNITNLEHERKSSSDLIKSAGDIKARLALVEPILQQAARINPNAPAEPLKLGLQIVTALGEGISPEQLASAVAQLATMASEAAGVDRASPVVPLSRAHSMLKEVMLGGSPDQTNRMTPELTALVALAARFDSKSPVAPLGAGLEILRNAVPDARPDKVKQTAEELVALIRLAARFDAKSPTVALGAGLEILKSATSPTHPESAAQVATELVRLIMEARLVNRNDPVKVLRLALDASAAVRTESPRTGKHDWPPIINLSEAEGYYFETGSAELPPKFQAKLSAVVEQLQKIVKDYGDYGINVVEVVGHTDEQPFAGRPSNLDKLLQLYLEGQTSDRLTPSDNAGLGLARAAAVVRALRQDQRLSGLKILPLTGAQLIDTGDNLSKGQSFAVKQRRRIEIRVRRSDRQTAEELPDLSPRPVPAEVPEPTAPQETSLSATKQPHGKCFGIAAWIHESC